MVCYNCGCELSEKDFCTSCGADVALYKEIMSASNYFYNEGLEKASVRDLSGAVTSLRQSLKFNKGNVEARNLLGLVYYEMGEVVPGLREWVISKNLRSEKNIADDYINMIQDNPSRQETLNQAIKKYNISLSYCQQDSLDLAIIQLKKVLSMNFNFLKAHQLLALLYMKGEEWEKARKELDKCSRIDTGNVTTKRYKKEVDAMLDMAESARAGTKKRDKNRDVIKYQSGNETIIQPTPGRDGKGVSAALNIGIGIFIGVAAACFLIFPARLSSADSAAQDELRIVSEQLDKKTSAMEEMTQEIERLSGDKEQLQKSLEEYKGSDNTMLSINEVLRAVTVYMENPQDKDSISDAVEKVNMEEAAKVKSEDFQNLCAKLLSEAGPMIAEKYYEAGMESYRKEMYEEAVENLSRALEYDRENGDILYNLGNSYRQIGNREEAARLYNEVIEKFDGTERARRARNYLEEMNINN